MLQIDLSSEQLFLLSAFATVGPARNSPLLRLSRQVPRTMTGASQRASIAALTERGLVAEDADGCPILAPALRPALVALHRPERVLRVVRSGRAPARVSWLCRHGDLWARSDRDTTAGIESLAWPLRCDDITAWFAEHLLADLPTTGAGGPTNPLAEVTLTDETHAHRSVHGTAFSDHWSLRPEHAGRARELPAHSSLPSVFHSLLALLG